jgi:hypothetical protein
MKTLKYRIKKRNRSNKIKRGGDPNNTIEDDPLIVPTQESIDDPLADSVIDTSSTSNVGENIDKPMKENVISNVDDSLTTNVGENNQPILEQTPTTNVDDSLTTGVSESTQPNLDQSPTQNVENGLTVNITPEELQKLTINLSKNLLINVQSLLNVVNKIKENTSIDLTNNYNDLVSILDSSKAFFVSIQESFHIENPEQPDSVTLSDTNKFIQNVLAADSTASLAATALGAIGTAALLGGKKKKRTRRNKRH